MLALVGALASGALAYPLARGGFGPGYTMRISYFQGMFDFMNRAFGPKVTQGMLNYCFGSSYGRGARGGQTITPTRPSPMGGSAPYFGGMMGGGLR